MPRPNGSLTLMAGLIVANVKEDSAKEEAGACDEKKEPKPNRVGDWSLNPYHL